MKPVSLKAALAVSVRAARAAGRLMYTNWYRPKHVNAAEAHDIKLELDVKCQMLIEKILAKAFPAIPVLGEEGSTGDTDGEYRWVIDPIDGTVNYFFGMPHAAVSIALQHKGESVVGVIFDPFTNELWTTTKGQPTRLNGRVIRVSDRRALGDCVVAIGFSKNKENLR
ncbi:MAG TPA: inositol monophosphatase family protein, partial [Verrucomicrobiae bacterium]